MDRQEKQKIRLQICEILNEKCTNCEIRNDLALKQHQLERYCLDQCPVPKELQSLNEQIESVKKVIPKEYVTGKWKADEVYYLMNCINTIGIKKVAEKLNRKIEYVHQKYKNELAKKKASHHAG